MTDVIGFNRYRRIPLLLGAVLHVQYHGRHMFKTAIGLRAGIYGLSADVMVGLRQLLHQSRYLHNLQYGVPQSLQTHLDMPVKI